ncbi:MAG: hypothetical protein J2P29_03775 [Actinobacteria bacterium]|nr:hypothetical protein [Actinomycetota bacterium]
MRTLEKALWFACLPLAGAGAGYAYLVRVLRPLPPVVACRLWQLHGPGCTSYEIIASKPFFLIAGALIGIWFGYAVAKLKATAGRQSFSRREAAVVAPLLLALTAWIIALHPGLAWEGWGGWDGLSWSEQVLLFLLATVLVRLAIAIATIANARGSLILAFGTPAIFAGLGYGVVTIFRQRPIGHSCPAGSPACFYYPLIGETGPWIFLGLLAGIWLAYATAADLAGHPRSGLSWVEYAIVLPVMAAVIVWALAFSHQQAGGGYVGLADLFVLAACLTALLRLLLGAGPVRRKLPGVLTRLGMVTRNGVADQAAPLYH